MKKPLLLLALLLILPGARGAQGLIEITSPHDVPTTVARLKEAVRAAGFKILATLDHARAAEGAGLELRPEKLLIFGKPKAGTLLMQSSPTIGIDLPMKYLVWEDAAGQTHLAWNDPAWLAARHGIADKSALVKKMQGALKKLAGQAVAP